MLFATLCYHVDYLNDHLHTECRFRASALFRDIPQEILDCAVIAYPWNATEFTPIITGVPPHVLLMSKMENLLMKFEKIRGDIRDDFGGMLDNRGVGGSEFHTNQILEAIKIMQIPRIVSPSTLDEESLAQSQSQSLMIMSDEEKEVESDSDFSTHVDITSELGVIIERRARAKTKNIMKKRQLTMGYHNGKLQVLPPRWQFPKMNAKQLIDNWYVGNTREKIPPLGLLTHHNVAHLGSDKNPNLGKVKLRQMRLVMSLIERYARMEHCYEPDKRKWTSEYTRIMWEKVGTKYIGAKFGGKNRNAELSWKTLFNKMMKAKAFTNTIPINANEETMENEEEV